MNIRNILVAFIASLIVSGANAQTTASLYYSLPAEYMIGQTSPTISQYNIVSTSGTTLHEVKFSIGSYGDGTVSQVSITTGGQTFSAPVVGSVADLSGLNIPVPTGGGVIINVTPTYTLVGGPNGIASNTPSTISLSGLNGTSIAPVASNTMTLVTTKPMVYLASGSNTVSANGQVELADILVTADQAGNVGISQIPLSIKTFGNVTIPNQSLVIKDSANNLVTNASANLSMISFLPDYTISAGTEQEFKVFANVQVSGNTGTNSITTVLGAPSSFEWTDIAGNVSGLTGDSLPGAAYSPTTRDVPEPSTATFLMVGTVLSLSSRKRRS